MSYEQDPQLDGSATRNELAELHNQRRSGASRKKDEEAPLPAGAAPIEAQPEPELEEEGEEGTENPAEEPPVAAAAQAEPEQEELIRIGDKEFKTQAEAIKYAETLAQEKLISEAYNQGVSDHIRATAPPVVPEPEKPIVTEEEFFNDPTGAIKKTYERAKEAAKTEVLSEIDKQTRREAAWGKFLTDNPDIERADAQRILNEYWETIGKMTDLDAAMKVLATKTRAYYQGIVDKFKPRKELPPTKTRVVSSGGAGPSGVTPPNKGDEALDFASQLRMMRKRV